MEPPEPPAPVSSYASASGMAARAPGRNSACQVLPSSSLCESGEKRSSWLGRNPTKTDPRASCSDETTVVGDTRRRDHRPVRRSRRCVAILPERVDLVGERSHGEDDPAARRPRDAALEGCRRAPALPTVHAEHQRAAQRRRRPMEHARRRGAGTMPGCRTRRSRIEDLGRSGSGAATRRTMRLSDSDRGHRRGRHARDRCSSMTKARSPCATIAPSGTVCTGSP